MHISNSYSLQQKVELKKGLFDKLNYVNLFLKIFALLSLVALFWSLWMLILTAVLIAVDVTVGVYRSKLLFTYTYRYKNGRFYVIKEDLDGKESVLEDVAVNVIKSCYFADKGVGTLYYSEKEDFRGDKPLVLEFNDKLISVLSDDYLYSIVCYGMKEKYDLLG